MNSRTTDPQPDSRLHSFLDGELAWSALTTAEQARAAAMESAIESVAGSLRAAEPPDLVDAVMQRLPARVRPSPSSWRRAMRWLWTPRPVRIVLRPAYMAAALAAVALAIAVGGVPDTVARRFSGTAAPSSTAPVYVTFHLDAPAASRVVLVGSFTNWQPGYELHETAPGVWSVMVPLEPGVHDYAFVVDGERWVVDPKAPRVSDSFGGVNSRLALPTPRDAA